MTTNRMTAIIVGVLYIIGTVAGILSVVFIVPIMDETAAVYEVAVQVAAHETQVVAGVMCVLAMGLALSIIPVVLFPILRKQHEILAIGYVVFRGALEGVIYIAIALSWLLLITFSRGYAAAGAADAASMQALGAMLLQADDWISQSLIFFFIAGALMFYTALYRSKLVPRWLSGWGLVGAAPYLVAHLLALFAVISATSTAYNIMVAPLALQEMALAVWLIVKGFNPSADPSESTRTSMSAVQLSIADAK